MSLSCINHMTVDELWRFMEKNDLRTSMLGVSEEQGGEVGVTAASKA